MERRFAAILAADVVGYSRLMGLDEAGTMARMRLVRDEVIAPALAAHRGRLFKTTGDGFLAEFASAGQAVASALAVQAEMAQRHAPMAADARLDLRIGVHSGDVMVESGDLFGDVVNIAARLESIADPGGVCISLRVREEAAGATAFEAEDLGAPPLKNIAQPVQVFRLKTAAPPRPALALPDKPSLAVLPFQNMSGEAEQEYFADGVVEDIITALSRTGWLFVIARNSSFAYKGTSPDIRQVGRELGVRYVLEGSVRRAGGRVRITCQLIEAATGGHVWADRFEGETADLFDLQDRITELVVGALEPSLKRAEIARAAATPTGNLDAYDLYLQALGQHYQGRSKAGMANAIGLLRRAIAADPGFMRAKALLAELYALRTDHQWGEPGDREAAMALAREALAANTDDPDTLSNAGNVVSYFDYDNAAALRALERARQLHPNSTQVLALLGWVCVRSDDPLPAIGHFERALRLSPLDPEIGFVLVGLGAALLLAGRTEEAVPVLRRAVQEIPNAVIPYRHLIHALHRLGQFDEAQAVASRLLAASPGNRVGPPGGTFNPAFNAERRTALLAAGIPE